ncbi:MAG: (d)CMP kinase [Bacteroidota bacterium]
MSASVFNPSNKRITIAVDGYSSCGKSTLAKAIAKNLDYVFVDSGAMYRAVTLYFIENNIPISTLQRESDNGKLKGYLDNIKISFEKNQTNNAYEVCLNGRNVEKEIRLMNVSENVSLVSTIKSIRQKLVQLQQDLGKNKGVVMDGRDIGTVVFPNAELKLFMTADINERANRRFNELSHKGIKTTLEQVKENINQRDYDDTHRIESPLVQATDAILIDNTFYNEEQSLQVAMDKFLEVINR